MSLSDENKRERVAKTVFWIGAVGDGLIAIEWFIISLGIAKLPLLPSFFIGEGRDYRFAVGVGAIFMLAWTFILYWGSRRPIERKGLLLITGIFLFIAFLLEILANYEVFENLLSNKQLVWGAILKLYLVIQFLFAYLYSRHKLGDAGDIR